MKSVRFKRNFSLILPLVHALKIFLIGEVVLRRSPGIGKVPRTNSTRHINRHAWTFTAWGTFLLNYLHLHLTLFLCVQARR